MHLIGTTLSVVATHPLPQGQKVGGFSIGNKNPSCPLLPLHFPSLSCSSSATALYLPSPALMESGSSLPLASLPDTLQGTLRAAGHGGSGSDCLGTEDGRA